jgi:predicted aspartyl protease
LLLTRAAFGGKVKKRSVILRLLLDTGASSTILSAEAVSRMGYDPGQPFRTERLVTANGVIIAPVFRLSWFNCLGQTLKDFPVVAHSIPSGIPADGLLGMDFLSSWGAVISVADARISFKTSKS